MSDIKSFNRLLWADSLKGWLMVLVIVGHAIQCLLLDDCEKNHLWNIIYSFHMPAFMAISGWFAYSSRKKQVKWIGVVSKRIYQLLLPYFLWRLIAIFVTGTISLEGLANILLSPDSGLWFLWTLFWINIIFVLGKFGAEKSNVDELYFIITIALCLLTIMIFFDLRIFAFQYIAYYFLFYTIGYILNRFSLLNYMNCILLVIICIAWFFLAWYWNMHNLPWWASGINCLPITIDQYAYRGFTAFCAIIIILYLAPHVLNSNNKFNAFISYIGTYSLGFYVVQHFIIGRITNILQSTMSNSYIIILMASFFSLIICYIIVYLLLLNKYTKLLLGKY